MKTEVRNEFILEAHKSACSEWKLKIENECPELFKTKLEVGKWYKQETSLVNNFRFIFVQKQQEDKIYGYGFTRSGKWFEENYYFTDGNWILANEKEIEEAILKEAKRQGFKDGVQVITVKGTQGIIKNNYKHHYISQENKFYFHNMSIFQDGKWATIISNPIEEKINDLQKQLDELKKQL